MRLALYHSTGVLWLAGDPAADERAHTSASDLRIDPRIEIQRDAFVRGGSVEHTDRDNIETTVSFGSTRQFATPAAAETWCALYDATQPRTGSLLLQSVSGTTITWVGWSGAVVQPPERQLIGCTVMLRYTALCGAAEAVTFASALIGSPGDAYVSLGGDLLTIGGSSLTFDPLGTDNGILFTAMVPGTPGNDISITIAAPVAGSGATTASAVAKAVTITPGAVARMIISGLGFPYDSTCIYAGTHGGKSAWATDGVNDIAASDNARGIVFYATDRWIYQYSYSGSVRFSAYKISAAVSPAGLTGWTGGSLTVTACGSTPIDAKAACAAVPAVAALVTVSIPSNQTGNGELHAVSATHLTGGSGLTP